jgi:N-acetylmuramoyl-L-alanine amidase
MLRSFGAAVLAAFALTAATWVAPVSTVQAAELAQAALSPAATSLKPLATAPVPAAPSTVASVATATPAVEVRTADIQPDDEIVYPTLAAAVAAQDVTESEDEALRCLATTIYFESKGEPLAGQLAVAQVVLNRVASGRFGQGVCGVVLKRGQFGFIRGGRLPAVNTAKATYRTALAVAKVAMAEAWDGGEAERALYFNSRPMAGLTRIASIGNHLFYR